MKPGLVLFTGALALGVVSAAAAAPMNSLQSKQDKISYALGYETGKAFNMHGVSINANTFSMGLQAGMQNQKPMMSANEMKTTLQNFQKASIEQYQKRMAKAASENQQKSMAYLAANKSKPGIKTLSNGVQYRILTPGTGTKPKATDTVTVNYEGKLMNGRIFDSSYQRNKPTTFSLSAVIPGWREALTQMKTGATWEIYIPPKLAYGAKGIPGVIGPNEVLIFKVNLIKINKKPSA